MNCRDGMRRGLNGTIRAETKNTDCHKALENANAIGWMIPKEKKQERGFNDDSMGAHAAR
jgi:hypothetical protein